MKKFIFFTLLIGLTVTLAFSDNSTWTFNSDLEGWNVGSYWLSTIVHDAGEGHDTAGCLYLTDADIWYGVRNTVTIGAGDPAYQIDAWVKLISLGAMPEGGLNLNTYALNTPGDTSVPFDEATTDVWQTQTQSGTAQTGGAGYIMIVSNAGWGATDPADAEFYLDDVTYTEPSGITDWALFN